MRSASVVKITFYQERFNKHSFNVRAYSLSWDLVNLCAWGLVSPEIWTTSNRLPPHLLLTPPNRSSAVSQLGIMLMIQEPPTQQHFFFPPIIAIADN